MVAALGAALVLTLAALSGPVTTGRTIAGTALPASSAGAGSPTGQPNSWRPSKVPAPPLPLTQYIVELEAHPLLTAGVTLPPVTCQLPRFGRDESRLRAYYVPLRDCLDDAWRAALTGAGLPWSSPTMNLATHPGDVFCGDFEAADFTAAYCPDSEMIFMPVDRLTRVDRGSAAVHIGVFAHEYGHHIQASVGILEAVYQREDQVGRDTVAGEELSRRTELQADCFAGVFLAAAAGRGSISRQLADSAVGTFRYGTLAKTHGPGSRQLVWARRGYEAGSTAACNTWSAPAAEVR